MYFHAAFPAQKRGGSRISNFRISFFSQPCLSRFFTTFLFFPFVPSSLSVSRTKEGREARLQCRAFLFFFPRFIRICGKLRNFALFSLSLSGNGILPLSSFRIRYVWPKYIFEGTKLFMGCDIGKNIHCPTFTLK